MIAHVDADSFFASVLQRSNPRLTERPLLTLGSGGGLVIAASYRAKAKGVRTGMLLREAKQLCPDAIAVPADFRETAVASRQIESILHDRCARVERASIDEWFLDLASCVGGIPHDLAAWGAALRQTVLTQTALSVSVGIAPSKTLAKMASEYRKPGGLTAVSLLSPSPSSPLPLGEGENDGHAFIALESFLRSLPAAAIPGIGRGRKMHVDVRGWTTAWDIVQADTGDLQCLFGKVGMELQQELRGKSIYPIATEEAPPKSISRCRSFRATTNRTFLWAKSIEHLSIIVRTMREHNLACREIGLWIRQRTIRPSPLPPSPSQGEGHFMNARVRLSNPATTEEELAAPLKRCFIELLATTNTPHHPHAPHTYPLFHGERVQGRGGTMPCTQIGVIISHLVSAAARQPTLFEDSRQSDACEALQESLDRLRDRFGRRSITRASAL